MSFLIDILHAIVGVLLGLLGFDYERQEECHAVRLEPAAYIMSVGAVSFDIDIDVDEAHFTAPLTLGRQKLTVEPIGGCKPSLPEAPRAPLQIQPFHA